MNLISRRHLRLLVMGAASLGLASPAFATLHLMQIEQVIGGVNGDTTRQAIQLRMRSAGQNLLGPGRLVAWDAAGANPVVIFDFTVSVPNGAGGSRVLVSSMNFANAYGPMPDALMTATIPASYLAAGKLTWQDDTGTFTWWSLAWGGAGYTGTNTGTTDNDVDGNFSPPFAGPLPSTTGQALIFPGAFNALSTNNAADYAVTAGDSVFTNNAGANSLPVPVELQKIDIE